MSRDRTSQRDINSRERQNQALGLRKAGATLEQISQACGYGSRSTAHKAIKRALAELPRENAEELRALEVARLDELLMAYWQRAKKDVNAAHLVLKIASQRAQLLGLNIDPAEAETRSITVIREVPSGWLNLDTSEVAPTLPPGDATVREYGVSIDKV